MKDIKLKPNVLPSSVSKGSSSLPPVTIAKATAVEKPVVVAKTHATQSYAGTSAVDAKRTEQTSTDTAAAPVSFESLTREDALSASSPHPAGDIGMCPFHNAVNRGDPDQLRQVAIETIRDKVFGDDSLKKAEKILTTALQADPVDAQGKTNHLLGLVAFREERWGDAMKHLEVAIKRDPENPDIQNLLKRSTENAGTRVDRPMGKQVVFDKEKLLESPTLQLREPQDIAPVPKKSLLEKLGSGAAKVVAETRGVIEGSIRKAAIDIAGKAADHSTTFAFQSWDKKSAIRGELELGAIRDDLNKNRLKQTYDGEVGFQKPGQVKPEWTDRFRTANGSWTTNQPMEGAAGTEFQATGTAAIDRVNRAEDSSLPSAREVSRVLLTATGERKTAPFLNNLAIAWIQFENHDWINHGPAQADGAYEIKLAPDDPLRTRYGMDTLPVQKTAENVLAQPGKLTHLNEVTHWWDGSQIYGSDQATQDRLRMGANGKLLEGGKLRIDNDMLPISAETGVEDSGFTRNWWVGLDLFHTLFVKNHNSIADTLKSKHPDWSTDQVFETAKLINAAEMAKIHTVEWTPAVLPNQKLVNSMDTNWYGLEEALTHRMKDRKTVRPLQAIDPVVGGIVGGKTNNHGKDYGLSEEFAEVYRLHAGMLDHVDVLPVGSEKSTESVTAETTRGAGARDMVEKYGMATLLNSFGNQKMTALVNNNYPAFMQDTSVDGAPVTDLGTIDILRARERGVPPYNEFRRKLGLNPLKSFSELGCGPEVVAKLEGLYGKGTEGLEKMDLLSGTLAEANRPENYGFGETLFTVFVQMASRRLEADPFYTEKYDAEHYTKEGLEMIDQANLKDLLLQHYPELAKTGLANVNNAFEPWSSDVKSHPEEHPLSTGLEKY